MVQHPERDTTFDCLTEQAKAHLVTDQPLISVDPTRSNSSGRT